MRIFNRLLAFVAALALAAVGVITIIEVIAERGRSSGPVILDWHAMLRWGQHNTWRALSVEIACAVTALVGLVLVLSQLRRRRPSRVAVQAPGNTSFALTRKGLAGTLRGAVQDVEGISSAKVKVRHRRITIRAGSAATTAAEANALQTPVREAADRELTALALERQQRLKVRVSSRRTRDED